MALVRNLDTRFQADLNAPCRLLSLPKELRKKIWSFVLLQGKERYLRPLFANTSWRAVGAIDSDHCKELLAVWSANWTKRKIDLLLVNKQLYREAGRIFWRKNEFRFHEWSDLYNLPFVRGQECRDLQVASVFTWNNARFSRFRSIRRVSLVGGSWCDQIEYGPTDLDELDRTSYYSGGVANFLVGFPNLGELLLGVGMVSTFMDSSTELGQRWQCILNVLRRSCGTLKVNFRHFLDDSREHWWKNGVQAKATISLTAKGALPLRETVWTLQNLAIMAQVWIDTQDPVQSDVVRPIARERIRKAQAKKLKHAQHVREGCNCQDCKAKEEKIKEDRLRRMTPLQKSLRPGQTSARAQLQSKWARQTDLSYDEEDVVEAQGTVSINGMKAFRADLQSPCRLLGLPKELREGIWSLVFLDPVDRYEPPRFSNTNWLNAYGSVQDWNPDVKYQRAKVFLAGNRKPRDLALLRVNKFVFREAGRLFFRNSEFRFQDWNIFSRLWRGKDEQDVSQRIPSGDIMRTSPYFQTSFRDFQLDLSRFRQNLSLKPKRFNRARLLAHISLVGADWDDQLFRPWRRSDLVLTKYYAGTVPYMLVMFPNLRQLDVGAAMLREFADYASVTGQRWQPVMNILRRNRGSLKAVLADELKDTQRAWLYRQVRLETSITIPARGKMPLREASWTLEEISTAVQLKINQSAPAPTMAVSCRGKKHSVILLGIPQKVSDLHKHKAFNKWQAKKLRRAQQYERFPPPGIRGIIMKCNCRACKYRKKVQNARASLTKEFKQYGGRQPKWAKHMDLSFHEGDEGDDDDDDRCIKSWRNGRPKWAREARMEEERERKQLAGDSGDGDAIGNEHEHEYEVYVPPPLSPPPHW
ncbi:hypothetical protein EG327_009043 [Venturia inaequalis]|uniref:F-box domain-containing protein n=1 Tax=Venturia inaequalis TaxID=5025 RepID=A0A8H3UPZ3_VENIN|nr:hypothetical protein EG327_009043 [Venturia inaequalis]